MVINYVLMNQINQSNVCSTKVHIKKNFANALLDLLLSECDFINSLLLIPLYNERASCNSR